MNQASASQRWFMRIAGLTLSALLMQGTGITAAAPRPALPAPAPTKLKLKGYLTARVDSSTISILDDQIQMAKGGHVELREGGSKLQFADLTAGELVEAEGVWLGKHRFSADRVTVDPGIAEKSVHETAYLQEEPQEAAQIKAGEIANLRADGEWLVLGPTTHRQWPAGSGTDSTGAAAYAGRQVRYAGVRREDGKIDVDSVELQDAAPADAYKVPHDVKVVPAKDTASGIDILEWRQGDKVIGRQKLFPVPEVQRYVADLGASLLPAGAEATKRTLEFRFFVVEDPSINAQSLPDGTVLVNSGLLGAMDNEAELAFVMSHEISHVLQVHVWREANETRAAKVGLTIVGIAAIYYIGDLGPFLSKLGIEAIVNGHQRGLENQADRLGVQTVIDRGYDPRQSVVLMRTLVDRYGDRTTSALWSNHESSVLRGSFLAVQIEREYPQGHFDGARVDTPAFQSMREAMGPVKIE